MFMWMHSYLGRKNNKEKQKESSWLAKTSFYSLEDTDRIKKEVRAGVKAGTYLFLSNLLFSILASRLGNKMQATNMLCISMKTGYAAKTVANPLYFILIAPILEEILFRGYITPGIQLGLEKIGCGPSNATAISTFFSSTIFALAHLPVDKTQAFQAFFSGLLFDQYTSENNGSLWQSTSAHITNNTIAWSAVYAGCHILNRM